jgi:transcriptional regulator with XRE-family HTH domain
MSLTSSSPASKCDNAFCIFFLLQKKFFSLSSATTNTTYIFSHDLSSYFLINYVFYSKGVSMKSNVEYIMKKKKITIRQLEHDSGLNNVTILRARKDDMVERCTLGTLVKIADALGVPVYDLFDDENGSVRPTGSESEAPIVQQMKNLEERIDKIESKLQLLSS